MPSTIRRHPYLAVILTALSMAALTVTPRVASAIDPSLTGNARTTAPTTAPGTPNRSDSAGDNDREVLHDDYDQVLAQEAVALNQLADTIEKRQGVEQQLYSLELQVQATGVKLDQATVALAQANLAKSQAMIALAQAETQLTASKTDLTSQVLTNYVTGGQEDGVGSALTGREQKDGQTQTYASAVVRHQKAVIRDYRDAKAERDRQAKLAADAEGQARMGRDDIASFKSALDQRKVQQVKVQQGLLTQQRAEQAQFNDLDKTKAQIVAKVVGLARDGDGITAMVNQAQVGQVPFTFPLLPLIDPTPGAAYTQGFGPQKQPVMGVQGSHPGIDLAGPAGAQVHAAGDGTVIFAGPLGGYGNAVIIDHGHHLATLYGHNQQVMVTVGQKVKQNDLIGIRGSTGFSTGPHVHFETRVNGVPVDPLLFVRLS